jgi:hypothetical protein
VRSQQHATTLSSVRRDSWLDMFALTVVARQQAALASKELPLNKLVACDMPESANRAASAADIQQQPDDFH